MNNFIRGIDGFYNNNIYSSDTDSLYIQRKNSVVLDKLKLVGEELCQGKIDNKSGGVFYSLFLSPNIKYCLTIHKFGIIQEHKTFKSFNDSKRLLDRSEYFIVIEGKKISAFLPKSWEKPFNSGIVTPTKMRFRNDCNGKRWWKNV